MLNAFVCGSFNHQEEDGPCNSPKKSKRKDSRDNNPYSSRGLDKFSALVADLDERRQKLYSQMSPQDISFVRFAYSNTDDFVPIVVKVKNKGHNKKHKVRHLTSFSEPMEKSATAAEATAAVEERKQPKLESDNKKDEKKEKKKKSFSWNMMKWSMLTHPSFYVPAVMILILVFLTLFGRSVATLCTCVVWYVVPTLSDTSKPRKTVRKKDYVRGLSEKKMATEGLPSPRSGDSKASKDRGSAKHSHQKSW